MVAPHGCRLAELERLSQSELLAEQARLLEQLSRRLTGVGPPQVSGLPGGRLTQAMHDYLDVQHVLRHLPPEAADVSH